MQNPGETTGAHITPMIGGPVISTFHQYIWGSPNQNIGGTHRKYLTCDERPLCHHVPSKHLQSNYLDHRDCDREQSLLNMLMVPHSYRIPGFPQPKQ